MEFDFRPAALGDRQAVEAILERSGCISCQYALANLYCLSEHYGIEISISGGALFVRHTKREKGRAAYLPPLCAGDGEFAKLALLAEENGFLFGLTSADADRLERLLPGRFALAGSRDWAEYIYDAGKLSSLSGGGYQKKRQLLRACLREYGADMALEPIGAWNIGEVAAFQQRWYSANAAKNGDLEHLKWENRGIAAALRDFGALGLRGLALRMGGDVAGYVYGCKVSSSVFDIIAEKADTKYKNLYTLLHLSFIKSIAREYTLVNCEEDIGLDGLRGMKLSYRPEFLLEKYYAYPAEASHE